MFKENSSADRKRKRALVVALSGDLGSGKTSFAQGAAKALGIKERVLSPTFVIERIYKIKRKPFSHFVHIDCYRFKNYLELETLGWKELARNPRNVIFLEWAERVKKILPKDSFWIHFSYTTKNTRHIRHT